MRILHTSDWHLGRSFHREGMLTHQASYVDHLLQVVDSERVDLVVVAGDVYDRALPPVDAVRLADETLVRLAASRADVVLTSGNHDSAQRLGFSSRLIDAAGVFIRTDPGALHVPIRLADDHGPIAVYAIPYLDPHAVAEPWRLPARTHEAALTEAMDRVRRDLVSWPAGTRSVVLAHAFVAGAQPSDSERDISVGGVSMVPTSVFDAVSYAALGHLHGRHTLSNHVRYSGSPLAYSFSEVNHRKGSWLIELDARGLSAAEFLDAPVPRRLSRVRGTLEELLSDPAYAVHEGSWVEATLTDDSRPLQAMDRLRRRFPHTLVLGFESAAPVLGGAPTPRTHARSDRAIALDYLHEMRGSDPGSDEITLLYQAIDDCTDDHDLDPVSPAGDP
ncbi:MAG: exonuclease SbcCD subunit D [Nocardioides sp.]